LSTQLEFELAQRFDDVGLEQCSRCRITFHLSVSKSSEFLDHFIKSPGAQTRYTPLSPQILSFTKPLANFSRKLTIVAPVATNLAVTIDTTAISFALRTATALGTTSFFATLLLPVLSLLTFLPLTLLTFLSLLTLLTFFSLLALLLSLLIIALLIPLLLSVATRCSFIETATQRIKTVSQLPRAIEILFGSRSISATGTLLSRLESLGHVVQTALDRALIAATVSALWLSLLLSLLIAIQRLFAFTNAIRDSIARKRIGSVFQLSRRTLLTLTSSSHPARRLFEILLQTVNTVSERIFPLRELLACEF